MDGCSEAAAVARAEVAELRERLRLTEGELQASLASRDCAAQDTRCVTNTALPHGHLFVPPLTSLVSF